ncbi:Type 1 glutamine amidotransferase-like domain-containing protein [Streptobacillus canis]|uniref:Type 1 glutamine amidotransferase-like domain-containing protein n=1 Tax=Streptobacillus canis TaxID=2678686 RepID=UPI0012E235A6|nr:Type 1 glutamine amidotransferase-like domain-containing protein [Streptobacillus canis]
MNIFLYSHFERTGIFLKKEVENKVVLFIPTASIHEEYRGYVDSAMKLWEELKTNIIELDISKSTFEEVKEKIENVDIIYFSGGNSFFLIDQIRKTGIDKLIEKHINLGKLFVGESAGAIICAKDLTYITEMDNIPNSYSQKDYSGLGLIDGFVVPHYLCPPFTESSTKIIEKFSNLNLYPISNTEALIIENDNLKKIEIKK